MNLIVQKPPLWVPGVNHNVRTLWQGCIMCLPLWEGAGDRVADVSGNGHAGVLSAMDPPTDWVPSAYGWALDFDGSNDRVDMQCGMDEPFSMAVLMKHPSGGAVDRMIVSNANQGEIDQQHRIELDSGPSVRISDYDGAGRVSGSIALVSGKWYVVVGIWPNDSYRQCFVDGVGGTAGTDTVNIAGQDRITLGVSADSTPYGFFEGQVAWAAAWNRALTLAEIRELSADPFCMFRPPSFSPFWSISGAAVGLGIPIAMHHYKMMRN